MRIGLTYDLRDDYRAMGGFSEEALAEFDSVETIDAIDDALQSLGFETDRIGHVRALAARLVAGETWDLVFNIAEGLKGRAREAQVPALLDAYGIPYTFSDALTHAVGLDKAVAKRIVRDHGIPTAPFHVIETESDAADCTLRFPVFVKPIAEGTGKGCEFASKVSDKAALKIVSASLVARFNQPAIAEAFLSGREFTVGIVGSGARAKVIAVMEIVLLETAEAEIYSFENKELCETRVLYRLADDDEGRRAGAIALTAYRALGCLDAARVDLRSDGDGVPHFMEVNTLAGLHPTHSDLPILSTKAGLAYVDLIAAIVASACERHGLNAQSGKARCAAS